MTRTSLYRTRILTALVLGVAAALVAYLPPMELNQRIDGLVFDAAARRFADDAPMTIAIVTLEDEAWLGTLAEIARRDAAKLLVTTLRHPPSDAVQDTVLGPTQIPLGRQLLRDTAWQHGGHLWLEQDSDGRVRSDSPHIDDAPELNSLASAAYSRLQSAPIRPGGRIRFRAPDSFLRLSPGDLQEPAGQLSDLIVVAGSPIPTVTTPVGAIPQHEFVAQALAAYSTNRFVRTSASIQIASWLLVLALIAFIARRPFGDSWLRWLYPVAGLAGLMLVTSIAYASLDIWVPVSASGIALSLASILLLVNPRMATSAADELNHDESEGPKLLAEGRLDEAWSLYRSQPPTRELFDELYELGSQLDSADMPELAAEAFHRIALVDVKYRDVAARLVNATRFQDDDLDGAAQERVPSTLGRYELLELIGKGSTGRVFLARDPGINRLVAVKVIDLLAEFEPSELDQAKDQFRREAETAGRLSHPNIVTIHDIGEADSLAYIAMEYLKGRHLSDFTDPDHLLPIDLILELGAQAADALDYAHDQNVVHRDIKPANIMYDSVSGSLTITDFGIARLIDVSRTRTGIVLGTPSFMAPEQLEGENVNGHTDLFALGVSLYELLTGRLPFHGASMTELMFVIANEPHQPVTAVRPELPASLDSVLDRALAKEPTERYARGADMADALRSVFQR